jgi:hypothetical protein
MSCVMVVVALAWPAARHSPATHSATECPACYRDQKVASREIRVWHFVIENGS